MSRITIVKWRANGLNHTHYKLDVDEFGLGICIDREAAEAIQELEKQAIKEMGIFKTLIESVDIDIVKLEKQLKEANELVEGCTLCRTKRRKKKLEQAKKLKEEQG